MSFRNLKNQKEELAFSSIVLSKNLGVPLTTIQRRRKNLERDYLETSYSLKLEKSGWRRVDLFIATRMGKTNHIAQQLLSFKEVTYVGKSIGEHTIDLRAEIIISRKLMTNKFRLVANGILIFTLNNMHCYTISIHIISTKSDIII